MGQNVLITHFMELQKTLSILYIYYN